MGVLENVVRDIVVGYRLHLKGVLKMFTCNDY